MDLKSFGATLPARPTFADNAVVEVQANGVKLPRFLREMMLWMYPDDLMHDIAPCSIDRTYKFYYGGAQKRPDAPYARPIKGASGQVLAHVGEGNRKDVRNAVEAAHKAAPGWGKRAAHNRAQIVFYMAENLELRREEFANRLAQLTGQTVEEGRHEVDLAVQRLFHWGAYADKYGGEVQVLLVLISIL